MVMQQPHESDGLIDRLGSFAVRGLAWRLGIILLPGIATLICPEFRTWENGRVGKSDWSIREAIDSVLSAGAAPIYREFQSCAAAQPPEPDPGLGSQSRHHGEPASLEKYAQACRDLSCCRRQALRRMSAWRTRLGPHLREKEREALELQARLEDWRMGSDSAAETPDRSPGLETELERCWKWQALHAELTAQVDSFVRLTGQLFDLAADAANAYEDKLRRKELEHPMRAFPPETPATSDLSGQAWDILSAMRGAERAIQRRLTEIDQLRTGRSVVHIFARPGWADVAFLMVQLETTQPLSSLAAR
jgi:hypothetical protein